ncbi:MAG: hypothetical protein K0Q58_339 [Microbacterium sp.]|jgi:hypothetical protein|nr:hypothetical protein [Microbacterium sp.]
MSETDFWLNPAGLREQAGGFSTYADQAASARGWLEDHTIENIDAYPAYARGAQAAVGIRTSLIDWFSHLESVLDGVATELIAVADEGEQIDLEEAARIDATDPDVYNDHDQSPSGGAGELAPSYERTDDSLPVYDPPTGGAAFFCDLGSYDHLNELSASLVPGDLLSPTQWIDTVLGWLGAQTMPERVLQDFGGRWGDLRTFADTLTGLGALLEDMHGHLASAAGFVGVQWQGNASASAQAYLADLLAVISDADAALSDAGTAFDDYCTGVEEAAEAVSGAMYGLYDAVLVAAIAAAAGGATAETGIGALLGFGTAGVALLRAWALINEVNDTLQNLNDLATILSALSNLSGDLSNFVVTLPVPSMEQTS